MRYPVMNLSGPSRFLGQRKRNPWDWLPPTPPVPPDAPPSLHEMAERCEALRQRYGSFPRGPIMLTSLEQDIEEIEQDRMDAFYDWWICEGRLKKLLLEWSQRRSTAIPEYMPPFARCPLREEPREGGYYA